MPLLTFSTFIQYSASTEPKRKEGGFSLFYLSFIAIPSERGITSLLSFPTVPNERGIGRRSLTQKACIQYRSKPAFFSIMLVSGIQFLSLFFVVILNHDFERVRNREPLADCVEGYLVLLHYQHKPKHSVSRLSFRHLEQRFRARKESDAIGRLQESIYGTARKYLKLKQ